MNLVTKTNDKIAYFIAAEKGKVIFHPDKLQAFHTSDKLAAVFLCQLISMYINQDTGINEPVKGLFCITVNPKL